MKAIKRHVTEAPSEEQIALIPLLRALGKFLSENYDERTTVGDVFKTDAELTEFAEQQLSEEQFQRLVALGLIWVLQ